jgi:YHS domain-containing protein
VGTWAITPSSRQRVPVARRQLLAEPAKLVVAVLAVGAAVALVLLLSGLRRGLEALVRDPVCGMLLEPGQAKASLELEGETYYFCATGCRDQFQRERA